MMPRAPANPDILKWARTTLNLTTEEVGERVLAKSVRQKAKVVAAWESGEAEPTYSQLEKLAYQVYKRPLALFFFPKVPDEEGPREAFRTLPDLEIAGLSSSMLRLVRRAQAMRLNLRDLCQGTNPARRRILRDLVITPSVSVSATSAAAQSVREYLGVPLEEQLRWRNVERAFSNWRDTMEANGVFVFKDAFHQDAVSGFSLFDVEFPLIYVNNSLADSRQVFTLFHELAHLLARTGGIDKVEDDYIPALGLHDRRVEIFCNRFAGAFLVPDRHFDRRIQKMAFSEGYVSELAHSYCVSREVVLRKFLDRGRVNQEQYEQLTKKWRKQAKRSRARGGNYYATQKVYLGKTYLDLAFGAYYRHAIDVRELADFLNMKVQTALNLEAAR